MSTDTDDATRPLRADARRNRERALAAAEEAFAELGTAASMEEIARRAGLGVGTVARSFGSKQGLIDAVLTNMFEPVAAQARRALEEPDPAAGLTRFVLDLARFQHRYRVLGEQLAEATLPPGAEQLRNGMLDTFGELVARAQAAGVIRDDIGVGDLSVLLTGVTHATAMTGETRPQAYERYVTILLDGLCPGHASPLPGQPDSIEQLRGPRLDCSRHPR